MNKETSVFRNLDLSNKRNVDESYEDYKHRRKCNNHILKQYMKVGGSIINDAFPQGIEYKDIFQSKQELEVTQVEQVEEAYIPTPNEIENE
tara:strand:+ start:153 stop:425 length:273 start_codon:yes stop_codon:yes gene_type:complete